MKQIIFILVLSLMGCEKRIQKPLQKREYSELEAAAMKEYTNEKRAYIDNCMNDWNSSYGQYYYDINNVCFYSPDY